VLENCSNGVQCKRFAGYERDKALQKEISDLTLQRLKDGAQEALKKETSSACRMCLDNLANGSCSICDRPLCKPCTLDCEHCGGRVCNFCYIVDYTKRWEQRSCVNCNHTASGRWYDIDLFTQLHLFHIQYKVWQRVISVTFRSMIRYWFIYATTSVSYSVQSMATRYFCDIQFFCILSHFTYCTLYCTHFATK